MRRIGTEIDGERVGEIEGASMGHLNGQQCEIVLEYAVFVLD